MGGLGEVNAVSGVTHLNNPGQKATESIIDLSDMAKGLLSNISDMQSNFQSDLVPAAQKNDEVDKMAGPGSTAETGAEPVTDAARMLVQQIEQSTQVQEQLTRFVMASSVSSSLGRNLNMFLRGQ